MRPGDALEFFQAKGMIIDSLPSIIPFAFRFSPFMVFSFNPKCFVNFEDPVAMCQKLPVALLVHY